MPHETGLSRVTRTEDLRVVARRRAPRIYDCADSGA